MVTLPGLSGTRTLLNGVLRWVTVGLTGAIVLGWTGLLSLYIRGRWIWGHWPKGGPEDPKAVGEGLHYTLAGYSAATAAICSVAILVLLAALAAGEQKGWRSTKIVALTTAILSITMLELGPVLWWYMD